MSREYERGPSQSSASSTLGKLAVMLAVLALVPMASAAPNKDKEEGPESVDYTPVIHHTFQPRQAPATTTRDDVKALENNGYVELGTIKVFYLAKKGKEMEVSSQLGELLLREAAARGGDVVRIDAENVPDSRYKKSKRGHCLNWEDGPDKQWYVGDGKGHAVWTTTHTRTCTDWDSVNVYSPGLSTTGSVWRRVQMTDKEDLGSILPHVAATGDVQHVKQLLQWGAQLNAVDDEGYTALHRALLGKSTEVTAILLENGADVNMPVQGSGPSAKLTPLLMAVSLDPRILEAILLLGAKVDQTDKDGNSPAKLAIAADNADALRLLAIHGANLNWQSESGETYLMMAAQKPHADSVKVLLACGADVNLKNKDGKTAADLAASKMADGEKTDLFTKNPGLRSQYLAITGYTSEARGRHDATVSYAQDWLARSPDNPEAFYWLAHGYLFEPSNFQMAADAFESLIRNSSKGEILPAHLQEARMGWPYCYEKAEMWQDAADANEANVRELPNDALILNQAAWFFATTKSPLRNPAKALAYANRAIAAAPTDANIMDTLAEAYFANGRIDAAVTTEQKALALAPDRDDLKQQMNKFRQAQQAKKPQQPHRK
jgi:tetratricopeptide (TPR) repeat protein